MAASKLRELNRRAWRRYPRPTTKCPTEHRIMDKLRNRWIERFKARFKSLYGMELE